MKKIITLAGLALLTACSAPGSGGGGGGGGGSTSDIPAVLSQNLDSAVYNPAAQTLTIQLSSLDAPPLVANYTRNAALDVPGYEAYETQFSSEHRHFVALFASSARNTVIAGVAADGGQFVNYFGGGIYSQVSLFTRPSSGLAAYDGTYAGLLNTGTITGPLDPSAPFRTSGTIRVTADFNPGGSVTGGITNRIVVDTGAALEDVFLDASAIANDGTFAGTTEFGDLTPNGEYGGTFAGLAASDIAGLLVFNPVRGNSKLFEHGVFVLACNPAHTSTSCP